MAFFNAIALSSSLGSHVLASLAGSILAPTELHQESWEERDARAPQAPITRAQMDEMVRLYKSYGLPVPPKNAKLYRVHQNPKSDDHKLDALVFVDEGHGQQGRCAYWGTRRITRGELLHPKLSPDPRIEPVKLTDPWITTRRRSIGRIGAELDFVTLWAITIQLSATGRRDLAAKLQPTWYNEFSTHSSFGWNAKWATPRGCVETIALDFAREEWCRPDGNRQLAARIVNRVSKGDFAKSLRAEGAGMLAALQPGRAKAGTVEALIDDLVRAPRTDDGYYASSPSVKRLAATGAKAIPALRSHLGDIRITRLLAGGFNGPVFNASVGFLCLEILRSLEGRAGDGHLSPNKS